MASFATWGGALLFPVLVGAPLLPDDVEPCPSGGYPFPSHIPIGGNFENYQRLLDRMREEQDKINNK